jgi:hypothetical protein
VGFAVEDPDLFANIYSKFQGNREELNRYTDAGHKLGAAIRSTVSVDDALYQLSEYPEAVELGKVCIIRSILDAERNSALKFSPTGRLPEDAGKGGWIEHLLSMAITGFKLSELKQAFKKITFINFNYDRCIEHYIFWALQRLGITSDESAKVVETLNIIRPYGTIGSILPNGRSSVSFGAPRPPDIFGLINRIRTFTESEALHDKGVLATALTDASMIIFLGFGFHPQNLRLLALSPTAHVRPVKILATVYEVHDANLPQLRATLGDGLRVPEEKIETHAMTASEILAKLRMKIMMAVG